MTTAPDPAPKPALGASVSVWFDSACPICRREIAVMRALDWRRRIAFVDLHGASLDCPLDPATLIARFHARDERNGQIVDGAAAFALMWRQLPLLAPLGLLARWPPLLGLLERGYRHFLRWRGPSPSLGRS